MRRLVDELALVEQVGHHAPDRFPHPVLARQHDPGLLRDLVPHESVEAAVAHLHVEIALDLVGHGRLFHHRRQLVEVADHDPALRQRHQRQRLVGAHLVGLVQDQPVEDPEAQPAVDGQPVAGAGDQVVGVQVVAFDQGLAQAARHLHELGDARLTHVAEAQQPLLAGVDGVVGVGAEQDGGVVLAAQDAADRFHDGCGLAGPRGALDQVQLAGAHAHHPRHRLGLLLVGVGQVVGALALQGDPRG